MSTDITAYEHGLLSSAELALKYHVTQRTIRNWLKVSGAQMQPHGGRRSYERCSTG